MKNRFFRQYHSVTNYNNESDINHGLAVGSKYTFAQNSQHNFSKSVNWMVVGDKNSDDSPMFIGIKSIRRGGQQFVGDVVAILDGGWSEVNDLYTTLSGNGSQTPMLQKGDDFAVELSRRVIAEKRGV